MKLSEFKAWFEGFTELLGDTPPNAEQFARIKEKVAKIDGTAVTPIVIHEWYRPYISTPYYPYTNPRSPYWGVSYGSNTAKMNADGIPNAKNPTYDSSWVDTKSVLYDLGKAEYNAMMVGNETGIYAVTS